MVMVELPPPGAGIGLGLKLTPTPRGTPEADKLIGLLKPPLIVVVTVDVPCCPCWTVSEDGDAEIVKLGDPAGVPCRLPAAVALSDGLFGAGADAVAVAKICRVMVKAISVDSLASISSPLRPCGCTHYYATPERGKRASPTVLLIQIENLLHPYHHDSTKPMRSPEYLAGTLMLLNNCPEASRDSYHSRSSLRPEGR
jgi:hypothetical protein